MRATASAVPALPASRFVWRAGGLVRMVRPHQWVKNVFVLAPVVFGKELFRDEVLLRAVGAFGVFCMLAGAVYAINDLVDAEADRRHPLKRHRPIASGRVTPAQAKVAAVVLVIAGLAGAALGSLPFFFAALAYLTLNLAYSFRFKRVAYFDVCMISTGFVLRLLAGGFATNIQVSVYLLGCTALLSLFLGFGKRRHELAAGAECAKRQRVALEAYSERGLDRALSVTGLATVATYVAYTLDPETRAFFASDELWFTTGFVVWAIIRFVHLVRSRPSAESPTQEMLKDAPFVVAVLMWIVVVVCIVYGLPSEASL